MVLPNAILGVVVWEIIGTLASFAVHLVASSDTGDATLIVKEVFTATVATVFIGGAVSTVPEKKFKRWVAIVFGSIIIVLSCLFYVSVLPYKEATSARYWAATYLLGNTGVGVGIAWLSMLSSWRRSTKNGLAS
jgi:cell division protein FtsW (lipid II flippase)